MKTNHLKTYLMLFASLAISFTACDKDDDDNKKTETPVVTPTPDPAQLEMHMHSKVGSSGFELNQNYTMDVAGETVTYSFTETAFYVSGITMKKMNGETTVFEDKYLLAKPATEEYAIGELEAVHYTSISLNVGVDQEANHKDPATYEAGHPLALQNPSMHWSWNPGYRFMVLEGNYSATSGESGTFTFHLGLDEYLRNVDLTFASHIEVEAGKDEVVHLEIDYAELLNGIDLRTENFTKSMAADEKPLAEKLANNIPSAIGLE